MRLPRLYVLALIALFSFGACGGDDSGSDPTPSSATTPQEVDGSGESPVGDREVNDSESPGPATNSNPS